MQKIFELGPDQFASGIAPGAHVQDGGLWKTAEGITTVRDPFNESTELGILQASPLPVALTGLLDTPWAWDTDVSGEATRLLYLWGNAGHLYSIDLSSDNNPVEVSVDEEDDSDPVADSAAGVFVFRHSDGNKYVYYAQLGQWGRWNPEDEWQDRTDNYIEDLVSTTYHCHHKLFDRVFYANGNYVGMMYDDVDNAGEMVSVPTALNLPSDMRVATISDDSHYLVFAATTNQSSDNLVHGDSRIFFWDTNSSSWEREWEIPDAFVFAIRHVGSVMVAVTARGLYAFTIDSPPEMILPFQHTGDMPNISAPGHYAADVLGGAILWGSNNHVSSWGKFTPNMKNGYRKPFAGFSGQLNLVIASAKTNDLFVATPTPNLYRSKWSGSDGSLTSISAQTVFIDLKRWWQIGRIVVQFAGQLETGDFFGVNLQPDAASDVYLGGLASFDSHGAIRLKEMFTTLEARQLSLEMLFSQGAPRIRSIEVWGDPLAAPTHSRSSVGLPGLS